MAKKYDIKTNKYGVGATTSVLPLSLAVLAACICWRFGGIGRVMHDWIAGSCFALTHTSRKSGMSLHRKLF